MRKCMTANEIADGLAQMHIEKDVNGLFNKRIQNMLRQQQAEIEALKAEASPYKSITNTKIEPTVVSYTHPVKELGYNDIMGTWWEIMPNAKSCEGVFEFARAILRKAQEK